MMSEGLLLRGCTKHNRTIDREANFSMKLKKGNNAMLKLVHMLTVAGTMSTSGGISTVAEPAAAMLRDEWQGKQRAVSWRGEGDDTGTV